MSYDIESDMPVKTDKEHPGFGQTSSYTSNMHMGSLPNPFSASMNHVFFSGAERRILLDEVIHLCQFGNNLVAVVGEEGVGKTAFLNQARFELAETAFCCFIDADQLMTPEDIFSQIISQLELPVSAVSSAGEMIATLRHAMAEGSMHRVVVIIDDAHQLNDSILSALISLLQGHQGQHLHILMGGEKDLVNRLDHFEMVDVLVYDVTLNPFTLDDTKAYLDFKLATAGYTDDDVLDDEQVESIWSESAGLVSQVNRIAERYLFKQDLGLEEEERPVSGLPLVHMALLVVLLAALIFALVYLGGDDGEDVAQEQNASPVKDVPVEVKEITLPIQTDNPVLAAPESNSANTVQAGSSEGQVATPVATDKPPVTENNTQAASNTQQQPAKAEKVTAVTEPKAPVAAPQTIAESQQKPVVVEPVPQASKESLDVTLQQELQKEALQLKEGAAAPVASTNASALSQDEQWLMALDDNRFVLQVIAAGQQDSVKRFIASQPNKEALRLITVERGGKPWYVVIVGDFADSDSARRAIQSLPQEQVNGGPWPRKASILKREIGAVHNN